MINRCLSTAEGLACASLDPRLVGGVDAVDGEALALFQIPVELPAQHLEVSLLHPAAMDRDDAELVKQKFGI